MFNTAVLADLRLAVKIMSGIKRDMCARTSDVTKKLAQMSDKLNVLERRFEGNLGCVYMVNDGNRDFEANPLDSLEDFADFEKLMKTDQEAMKKTVRLNIISICYMFCCCHIKLVLFIFISVLFVFGLLLCITDFCV